MLELLVVHLFEMCDPTNVESIPAGLPEHVGADQPLHHDGKPGSEVIPDVTVAKDHSDQGNDVEEEEKPGGTDQHLDLPRVVFEPAQLVSSYGIVVLLVHAYLNREAAALTDLYTVI